jgi:hypothetical protein
MLLLREGMLKIITDRRVLPNEIQAGRSSICVRKCAHRSADIHAGDAELLVVRWMVMIFPLAALRNRRDRLFRWMISGWLATFRHMDSHSKAHPADMTRVSPSRAENWHERGKDKMSLDGDSVVEQIDRVGEMYHRLVLVVAPSGAGKTAILHNVSKARGVSCINVNLELSKHMLDLTTKQRAIHAAALLREVIEGGGDPVRVLDNLEILFDRSLQLDPLRILKELARQNVVVASWNGRINAHGLSYGDPDHPEYRLYPPSEIDFLHVTTEGNEG